MKDQIIKKWNMLDSYCEGQAIYGRDAEISSIKESILYNIQTFIYGKSGIGKTSLLQAGVFPKLRQAKYFPVIIRLSFYNKESLNHAVKRLVEEEAEREDLTINKFRLHHHVIDGTEVLDSPLYEYFSKVQFEDDTHTPYIPILVFDQFEETINNEEQWQRTVDFLKEDLYDLIDNSNIIHGNSIPYTNYRIVFSMREDYLYCLEDIIDRYSLWELRYNRYRIKALDDEGASNVIRLTSGTNGLEKGKEDIIVKLIIKIVKNNSGSRFTEINTALLSLICSLLYENSNDKCIYYQDLRKINVYLNSYYDTICDEVGKTAADYLEGKLLTQDGRRSSVDEMEIISSRKVDQRQLDYLVDKRFLRRIKADSTSIRYEYIHDIFARMIFKRRMNEKKQWYLPEISSISKKIDRTLFIKKFSKTTIVLLVFGYASCLLANWSDNNYSFHINFIRNRQILYIISFLLLSYLLPLIIKRLHDVGRTGWWISLCGLFPMIYTLFQYSKISIGIQNEYLAIVSCCLCFAFLGWLCIKPSVTGTNPAKYSYKYEEIYNGFIINNIQFAKSFLLELYLWIANHCFVMMILYIMSYRYYLYYIDFSNFYNDFLIFKWFGSNLVVPSVLALFPFALCFSPSLKARIKTIGYPIELANIPYFNILLLIEGLFSDKLLHTLNLWREPKIRKKYSEDDVFLEIHESLFQNNKSSNNNWTKQEKLNYLATFIPFYGLIRFLNHKISIKQRIISYQSSIVCLFIWLVFCIVFLVFGLEILSMISLFIALIQELLFFTCLVKYKNLTKAFIINEIRKDPNYIDYIILEGFGYLLNIRILEKIITELSKDGYIKRVVSDEGVYLEIDKERCAKYMKYYD